MIIKEKIDIVQALVSKANTLIEALPWLEKYAGKIVVIKYGGNAMVDEDLKKAFAEDIIFLRRCGLRPVVVHGGGPQISKMLQRVGIETKFHAGMRITTPEAMEIVRMVLVGQVGRELVGMINAHGAFAIGMSGEDGGLFTATRCCAEVDGEKIDLGQVGDISAVNVEPLVNLIENGRIPVVATVAPSVDGEIYNVNADIAAAALAEKLNADRLVMLTDVDGLYLEWPNKHSLVSQINTDELRKLLPKLESGMIPKMSACLSAVENGVNRATIIDGRIRHCLLLEIFTNDGLGTMVISGKDNDV